MISMWLLANEPAQKQDKTLLAAHIHKKKKQDEANAVNQLRDELVVASDALLVRSSPLMSTRFLLGLATLEEADDCAKQAEILVFGDGTRNCIRKLNDHAITCRQCNRVICALQEMLENLSAKCLVRDRSDIVRGPACGAVYQASRWGRQIFAPIAAAATTHVRGPPCGDLTGPRAKTAPEI